MPIRLCLLTLQQANNSLLGGSIDMVRMLTEHWRELLPVLTGVNRAYGAYRTATLLVNTATKKPLLPYNKCRLIIHS